ncbi:MAG: hypothetical protein ACK4NF_04710, partial [Planctomycetota bacterium]
MINKTLVLLFLLSIKPSLLSHPLFSYLTVLKEKPVSKINLKNVLFNIDKLLHKNSMSKKQYQTLLNTILSNIRSFTRDGEQPKTIFYKVSEYLTRYEAFLPVAFGNEWDTNLFTAFVKNRKGSCLPFSLLYLIISQHLGLPVYASLSPEHIFIKYNDKKQAFNIETVYFEYDRVLYEPGTFISSSMYKKALKIPPKSIKKGFFLQQLNHKETIGIYLNNIGALILQDALSESDYNKFKNKLIFAKRILIFSLKFYPHNFSTFFNLATLHLFWLFDQQKAKKLLIFAKKILNNTKIKILQAEYLIKTTNPLFLKYIKRINIPAQIKLSLQAKYYLIRGNFKRAKNYYA